MMLDHDPPCSNFLIRGHRLICELYILRFVVVVVVVVVAVECYCQEAARVWLGTNRQPDVSKHNTNHSGKLWSRRLKSIFPHMQYWTKSYKCTAGKEMAIYGAEWVHWVARVKSFYMSDLHEINYWGPSIFYPSPVTFFSRVDGSFEIEI